MKLTLTGPQAITMFPVKSMEMIPPTAKSSSFATPQGYVCTDTGNVKMYIKGQEYTFVSHEHHEEELAKAVASSTGMNAHCDTAEHSAIHERLDTMDKCIEAVEGDIGLLMRTLYTPLKMSLLDVHK